MEELKALGSLEDLLIGGPDSIFDGNSSLTVDTNPYQSVISTNRWKRYTSSPRYENWISERLGEIASEELLKITQQQKLSQGYPHTGWIFLKEARDLYYDMSEEDSRVTILTGQTKLEDDVEIKIAIVEKPREISLFICPESIGTVWEMDEFRELFIGFFDKYIEKWQEKIEEDREYIEPVTNPWRDPYRDVRIGGPGAPGYGGLDDWIIGDNIKYEDANRITSADVNTTPLSTCMSSIKDFITSKLNTTSNATDSL